ncbi:hypothetical protein RI129_012242 [Pyrocoelia pectoralis]|uniref:Uncharacterized protein n=1 Tax=Pyrocoelia pectoralis TaxID=417401 RepID=A0AAN7UXE7_9COLE
MSPQTDRKSDVNDRENTKDGPANSQSYQKLLSQLPPGEELVISGITGRFPESDNVYEYRDNLMNKVDMVTSDTRRWNTNHPEIPRRTGKINFIEKFDSGFFGIHYHQVHAMDPVSRLLLEGAIEAVLDAGYHPDELKGTRTGVFTAACIAETEKSWFFKNLVSPNFGGSGCTRSMQPNWISKVLQLEGPSVSIDTACSSSLTALDYACRSIRMGKCDAAIVGSGNLCMHPKSSLQFFRLGVLSTDGSCKSFDEDADGYARSEAVSVMFIQKSKDARRIYATIVHTKVNCDGYKEQGITYPSGVAQKELLLDLYRECNIQPTSIDFLEAHATGTKVGDPEEILAMDEVYCTTRQKPLYVGSVKSNHGHTEPVSGLCSLTKLVLAMENDCFLPNISYSKPKMEALAAGRMIVHNGLMAVNNFGFGGANAHVLLRRNTKLKIKNGIPEDDLPRLVCFSGRNKEAIDAFIADIGQRKLDAEFVRLMHEIFSIPINGHLYRGFTILTKSGIVEQSSSYITRQSKSLCLIFGGPNPVLLKFAQSLRQFPIYTSTVTRLQTELNSSSFDLMKLLSGEWQSSKPDLVLATIFTQLILAEFLKHVELSVDYVVGYSTGEIAAGYITGSLSLREAVTIAFHLSESLRKFDSNTVTYQVHLGKNIRTILPNDFEVITHTLDRSYTIAGPPEKAKQFAEHLRKRGVVVREAPDCLGTYCKYQGKLISNLKKTLKSLVRFPKKRTTKWISVNGEDFSPQFLISSILNLTPTLNSTLLKSCTILHAEENLSSLGDFAMQSQLKMEPGQHFLITLGKLYELGHNAKLNKLYPSISWPLGAGTPMVSPLIKWNHENDWFVALYSVKENIHTGETSATVSVKDKDWEFITGHVIDGRNLIPATAYLNLVWEIYAALQECNVLDISLVFEDIQFHRATNLSKANMVHLFVSVEKTTGVFEVAEIGQTVVSGKIRTLKKSDPPMWTLPSRSCEPDDIKLSKKDIYKELKLRGYNYSGLFRGVESCNLQITKGSIEWADNWTAFMDNMLQIKILEKETKSLYVPTYIERVIINPDVHKQFLSEANFDGKLPVYISAHGNIIRSGGVEIKGLLANIISKRKTLAEPVLETYKFVPLEGCLNLEEAVRVNSQIILENKYQVRFKCVEVMDDDNSALVPITPILQQAVGDVPLIQPELTILSNREFSFDNVEVKDKKLVEEGNDHLLVILTNAYGRPHVLEESLGALKVGGFVLTREAPSFDRKARDLRDVNIISIYETTTETLILLQKKEPDSELVVVDLSNAENFEWLPTVQTLLKNNQDILLVAQNNSKSGVLGFINCLRREPYLQRIFCMFIVDDAPEFDMNDQFYSKQLKMKLALNVYKDGKWGTYRHLLLEQSKLVQSEHIFSHAHTVGDLSSMRWSEGPLKSTATIPTDTHLVHIDYAALNFRDVMTASGRISTDIICSNRLEQQIVQGLEFSGRLSSGESVMGMVRGGALSSMVLANHSMTVNVPEGWSMEEAATVSVTYSTVLLCLEHAARIKRGQSILIHSGTGGVGQSAINVALYYKCQIFVTVGSQEKRTYIRQHFPEIPGKRPSLPQFLIGSSRSPYRQQKGGGVDLILNSLSEDKLQASLRCLARGGKFLEIGKFDMEINSKLKCELLNKGRGFYGVMLDRYFNEIPSRQNIMLDLLKRGIKKGFVKPLPYTVHAKEDIEQAFRFMAGGKHTGKILLKIAEEDKSPLYYGLPRYAFHGSFQNCSIIVGGLGGFGLEVADWLVLRGVKNLVLVSRNGVKNGYQATKIMNWKQYGVTTLVSKEDVTTREGCVEMFKQGNRLGPIESIFNLAVVLQDAILENQSAEMFATAFGPKAVATKLLDEVSREMCPELRHFVVFSSVVCGRGNAGQTNYGMANSIMERICEARKTDGYPALAIQWGSIGEVGLVAEMQELDMEIEIGGTLQQKISSCLNVLDTFLSQDEPVVSSIVVAEKKWGRTGSQNLVDIVMNIMGIKDLKNAGIHTTFSHMGVDSIMAVEIKQTLEREFNVNVSAQDIRGLTFAKLQEMENERLGKEQNSSVSQSKFDDIYLFIPNVVNNTEEFPPLVRLESLVSKTDVAPCTFFLPGVDGTPTVLEPLAANLNCHVYCIQYEHNDALCSIEKISQQILIHPLDFYTRQIPFTIIAHSFGCVIALHLVSLLESKGYRGQVILIDGSPNMFKQLLNTQIPNIEDEKFLQTYVLAGLAKSFIPLESLVKFKDALLQCEDLDGRINVLLRNGDVALKDRQKEILISCYGRIKSCVTFVPLLKKIKSSVTLFKPTQQILQEAKQDYDIEAMCESPVSIKIFDGNHITILKNYNVALEINRLINENFVPFKDSVLKPVVPLRAMENLEIKQI